MVRENLVKKLLKAGETVFGTMIKEAANPSVGESLWLAGFDFFVVDMEHCPYDFRRVADILQYSRRHPITGIVRISRLEYSNVARCLDAGAEGIWVPHLDTPEEARDLVRFASYPPRGIRGAAIPQFRAMEAAGYGSAADYFAAAEAEILLIAQIESVGAVERIQEIISVPGIDVAMMGTLDLSMDAGFPGQRKHPGVRALVGRVADACRNSGVAAGNHLGDIEELRYWMSQGMRMITHSYETDILIAGAKDALRALKAGEK